MTGNFIRSIVWLKMLQALVKNSEKSPYFFGKFMFDDELFIFAFTQYP